MEKTMLTTCQQTTNTKQNMLSQKIHIEDARTISFLEYPRLVSGQYLRCLSNDWCISKCPWFTGHSTRSADCNSTTVTLLAQSDSICLPHQQESKPTWPMLIIMHLSQFKIFYTTSRSSHLPMTAKCHVHMSSFDKVTIAWIQMQQLNNFNKL